MRALALTSVLLLFAGLAQAAGWSRDLACDRQVDRRARVLCEHLEREMTWRWLGHAVIAPGWRVTFDSAKRVYCMSGVTEADVAPLLVLMSKGDAQLENGAQWLLRMLGNAALASLRSAGGPHAAAVHTTIQDDIQNSASRFNPQNPSYVMQGGCVGR